MRIKLYYTAEHAHQKPTENKGIYQIPSKLVFESKIREHIYSNHTHSDRKQTIFRHENGPNKFDKTSMKKIEKQQICKNME